VGIYRARERTEDFPDVSGRLVAAAAADAPGVRPVAWLPKLGDACRYLSTTLRDGDVCLLMGAGDVDRIGRSLVS
jgi:UDP-N-acetylmuramate--alanine ligase